MTPPDSGSSVTPSGAHRVDDPVAARLLTNEGFRTVLDTFIGRERSVAEAAHELRLGLDATLYRVRRLHRAGLLELRGMRPRGGRPVKLYRAVHEAWFVPFESLPHADLEETFLELHVAHARVIAKAAARAGALGVVRLRHRVQRRGAPVDARRADRRRLRARRRPPAWSTTEGPVNVLTVRDGPAPAAG